MLARADPVDDGGGFRARCDGLSTISETPEGFIEMEDYPIDTGFGATRLKVVPGWGWREEQA